MIVHVYTIVRNEAIIMPYFLRHYSTFADRIFVIDDHSDDGTKEIVRGFPKAFLLDYDRNTGLDDFDHGEVFQEKIALYSRRVADWVICPNADEFVYHKRDMRLLLAECKDRGFKALISVGFTMISEHVPTNGGQIYDEIREGVRDKWYDKALTFDPSVHVVFGRGRHTMTWPDGIQAKYVKLMLLHYRFLSKEYIIEKNFKNYAGFAKSSLRSKGIIRKGVPWTYEEGFRRFMSKTMATYEHGLKNKVKVI